MKKIDIKITQARIKSFNVELNKSNPAVTATVELLTKGNETITTFSVSSEPYYSHQQFEVPIAMIISLKEIGDQLEKIVAEKCNERSTLLEGPK